MEALGGCALSLEYNMAKIVLVLKQKMFIHQIVAKTTNISEPPFRIQSYKPIHAVV